MLKMYAITNCTTVKKARAWLENNKIDYEMHDYKKQGVPVDLLDGWLNKFGWENLVNRKGMTWRKLTEEQKAAVKDNASAKAVMLANASIIKRPLLTKNGQPILLGFELQDWQTSLL